MDLVQQKRQDKFNSQDAASGSDNTNVESDGEERLIQEYHPNFDKYTLCKLINTQYVIFVGCAGMPSMMSSTYRSNHILITSNLLPFTLLLLYKTKQGQMYWICSIQRRD